MIPNTVYNLMGGIDIVQALLHDIKNGFFRSFEDIIHGELFSDFLEMAEQEEGIILIKQILFF